MSGRILRICSLDQASLSHEERRVLDRFVSMLRERLGDELHAAWLFGSRARGEQVDELSDIDVLVIADRTEWAAASLVLEAVHDAAREVSLPEVAWSFSVHVHEPAWVDQRRSIESFFMAEVDRDHIDLAPAA
jgi:predicted nucleotidyltransferase